LSGLEGACIRDSGEAAVSVELGGRIDPSIHEKVLALDAAVRAACIPGVRETVPSYRALLIVYEPEQISRGDLIASLDALEPGAFTLSPRVWRVPVCFEGEYADDMGAISDATGLPAPEIVAALTASPLRLYMYGFAPGFAYLGGLDSRLAIPRRATPRAAMPPGSLMIAGGQASLASVSMPTGWYVAGRTPIQMFRPDRDPMVPFQPGDAIALEAVTMTAFEDLHARGAAGEPLAKLRDGHRP